MRCTVPRAGQSLIDVVFVVAVVAMVLIPLVNLSSRNVSSQADMMERALVENLCLDTVERFKKYKSFWPLPGAGPQPPRNVSGPPLWEIYGAVDLRPGKAGFFDRVYLDQMRALGMSPQPQMEVSPDPAVPGLFQLQISVAWRSRSGQTRRVKFARWCYAP